MLLYGRDGKLLSDKQIKQVLFAKFDKQIEQVLFAKFDKDMSKRSRLMRGLLVLDQTLNVWLWNGSQDETVSSHIHRRQLAGTANWFDNSLCWILKKIESKHCLKSLGE